MASKETVSTAASEDVTIKFSSKGDEKEGTEATRRPSKEQLILSEKPKKAPGRIDEVHTLSLIAVMGGLLCLNSGWVNAVAFRGFDGGITHVTGTATNVGINLASQEMLGFLRTTA